MPLASVIAEVQAKANSVAMTPEMADKVSFKLGLKDVSRETWIAAAGQIVATIVHMDEVENAKPKP